MATMDTNSNPAIAGVITGAVTAAILSLPLAVLIIITSWMLAEIKKLKMELFSSHNNNPTPSIATPTLSTPTPSLFNATPSPLNPIPLPFNPTPSSFNPTPTLKPQQEVELKHNEAYGSTHSLMAPQEVELTYNEAYGSTRDLAVENSTLSREVVGSGENYEQLQVSIPDARSIDQDEEDYDYVVES